MGRWPWCIRTHVLVDTKGDDNPENDEYDVSFSWSGPHFVSDTQPGSQYCEFVDQALAADRHAMSRRSP